MEVMNNYVHAVCSFGKPLNTVDEIRESYDAQAEESYAKKLGDPFFERYGRAVGRVLAGLDPTSILDAGCGDGVTLVWARHEMFPQGPQTVGIDLSVERLRLARTSCIAHGIAWCSFFRGELSDTGLIDEDLDAVFTSHAMEPNGGREVEILRELARVAKRYVVLFEPDYDAAPPEGKARMERLNYVRNIRGAIKEVGLIVERDEPFSEIGNPLNPTNVWVLRK